MVPNVVSSIERLIPVPNSYQSLTQPSHSHTFRILITDSERLYNDY
jgi:hypothetical protein